MQVVVVAGQDRAREETMDYGRVVVVEDLGSVKLQPARPAIYDRDIGLRLLFEDPGSGVEHYLIRYPAGLQTCLHQHSSAHTVVVLEGRLEVNGRVVSPGTYCHFPAGEVMRHAPADGESCLLLFIFDGPVDVEPLEE